MTEKDTDRSRREQLDADIAAIEERIREVRSEITRYQRIREDLKRKREVKAEARKYLD